MKTSIVFFGTPEFALETLINLRKESQIDIRGVVSSPDKKSGRGLKIKESDVTEFARKNNLPLLQPEDLRDSKFLEVLSNWEADIFVVVAFKKLPETVWSVPKLGCFNIHASLLPDYRGAAPIHWSIANGETKTGVTSFLINNVIDSGEILLQKSVQIGPNETLSSLYGRLKQVGSELAIETIYSILGEKTKPKNQKLSKIVKKAPKIYSEFGYLELLSNIQDIHNRIRACDMSPGASIPMLNGQNGRIKLYNSKIINNLKRISYTNNIQVKIEDNGFFLEQGSFAVEIHTIQWPGKRRMDTSNFLKGYRERGCFSIFGKKIL